MVPISGNHVHAYYLAIISPRIYATISVIRNLQYNFPKMRGGGGEKALRNFSKNSSDLVAGPFPMESIVYDHSKASDGILQYPPRS